MPQKKKGGSPKKGGNSKLKNPAGSPGGRRPEQDPTVGGKTKGEVIRETQPARSSREGQGAEQQHKDQQRRSTGKKSGGK